MSNVIQWEPALVAHREKQAADRLAAYEAELAPPTPLRPTVDALPPSVRSELIELYDWIGQSLSHWLAQDRAGNLFNVSVTGSPQMGYMWTATLAPVIETGHPDRAA